MRGSEYDALIEEKEARYAIPHKLLKALIFAESGFDSKAHRYEKHIDDVSYGLCQILYKTAVGEGFKGKPNDLYDPATNLEYGAKYLSGRLNVWKNEEGIEKIKFGLGSYNAGIGNILKAQRLCVARKLPDNLWQSIVEVLPSVTKEASSITIRYVDKILAQWEKYKEEAAAIAVIGNALIEENPSVDAKSGGQFAVVRLVDGKTLNMRIYIEGQVLDAVMQLRREEVE